MGHLYQGYLSSIKDKKTRIILGYLLESSQDQETMRFSCLGLSKVINVYRKTIAKKIIKLEELKYVSLTGRTYTFNAEFTRSCIKTIMTNSCENNLQMTNNSENDQFTDEKMTNNTKNDQFSPLLVISDNENNLQMTNNGVFYDDKTLQMTNKSMNSDEKYLRMTNKNDQCYVEMPQLVILNRLFNEKMTNELGEFVEDYDQNDFKYEFLSVFEENLDDFNEVTPEKYAELLISSSVRAIGNIFKGLDIKSKKKTTRNEETEESNIKKNKKKEKIKKKEKTSEPLGELVLIGGETQKTTEKVEENFRDRVEIIELQDSQPFGTDYKKPENKNKNSQLSKKTNPYSDKPYFSEDEIMDMTETFQPDEIITSPLRLFINIFWWDVWNMYNSEYNTCDYDEEGNEVEDEDIDDMKMIGYSLPAKEIIKLAMNVYEDVLDAADKGYYTDEYGEYKVDFKNFQEFNPVFICDWKRTTDTEYLGDGAVSMEISLSGFRNINAEDIIQLIPEATSIEDKRKEARLNKDFISQVLSSKKSELSDLEHEIKLFFKKFVEMDESGYAERFTDGDGGELTDSSILPDHLLSTWLKRQGYKLQDFYDMLQLNYRPMDGLRITSFIFSCRKVARLNELHGITGSIASKIIKGA